MSRNPKQRPTVDEALAHPWFSNAAKYHSEPVFNENERAVMIKEYLLAQDE